MRWTFPLVAAVSGCGPGIAAHERLTCGREGPVRVLENVLVGFAAYAGDRILAHTGSSFPLEPHNLGLLAVGECGEDRSSIADLDLTMRPTYSAAGPHALRIGEGEDLWWVDTLDLAPHHPLISGVASCVLPVGDGLASDVPSDWVRTQSGNLLFIDRDRIHELGPLVLIEVEGNRRELATNVSAFSVPDHGTDRERNEVIYFVAEGADRGMWRLVLP